jgi:hypothetical protein
VDTKVGEGASVLAALYRDVSNFPDEPANLMDHRLNLFSRAAFQAAFERENMAAALAGDAFGLTVVAASVFKGPAP